MASTKHSLDGKVVLVTGSSKGIGAVTAIHFASLGSQVALTGRDEARLLETAAECERQPGATKPFVVVGDLTKSEDVRRVIDNTVEHFGRLDVLVNNAGGPILNSVANTTMEEFDSIMNLNIRAMFHVTSLAIPHLVLSKGTIVNVSSIFSEKAISNWVLLCISKAAVDQYTRSLALELAEYKIRVNSVNPGVTETHATIPPHGINPEQWQQILAFGVSTNPLGRNAVPSEVARAIAFLASDDASFINGVHLRVDGGYMVKCAV